MQLGGVYDDDTRFVGAQIGGLPWLGTVGDFLERATPDSRYFIGIGNNAARERIANDCQKISPHAVTIVHPTSAVSPSAEIHEGTYVAAFSFVGPNSRIGRHAIVNVGVSIGHDAVIEDFAHLCPGVRVSGYCQIGKKSFLGSNAVVAPSVRMGAEARLGAASFAHRNVPDGRLALGCPARVVL